MWTGEQVRRFRVGRRQNQTEFAAALGVSRQTVSEWERSESEVSPLSAAALDRLAAGANTAPPASDATAELRGRALEVSALLAYALERQNLLAAALYSPPERGSDAQAIAAADAAIPSAPAGAPRGARQRRHGTG